VETRHFKKVLAANRGEIAIRIFRACSELGIATVAIYSQEDKLSLYRYKADEAYLVGKGKGPIDAYLGIDEIIELALSKGVDAIHPGYGFLSENAEFAEKCEAAGIVFIGPTAAMQRMVGDKIAARKVAIDAGVPVIPGTANPVTDEATAVAFAEQAGYPLIIKAAAGGGGRGMRVARNQRELLEGFGSARQRGQGAFRQPGSVPRALHRAAETHRGAGARRPLRQPGAPFRAGLLDPAAAPEGGGVWALRSASPLNSVKTSARRPSRSPATSATATPARWSSSWIRKGTSTSSR
jgi:pyruvate carboxylase